MSKTQKLNGKRKINSIGFGFLGNQLDNNYVVYNIGDSMDTKFISRSEEFLLLAVWRLKEGAYGVAIRSQIKEATGKTWAYGALFVMLSRLEKKGHLTSYFSDPSPQRGGKSKRIFQLSPQGIKSLEEVRKAQESVWAGISDLFAEQK
jgi:PadR family transcriptional regulator, regulatory protein PadR